MIRIKIVFEDYKTGRQVYKNTGEKLDQIKYAVWLKLNCTWTEMFYFIIARQKMSVKGLSERSNCCHLSL